MMGLRTHATHDTGRSRASAANMRSAPSRLFSRKGSWYTDQTMEKSTTENEKRKRATKKRRTLLKGRVHSKSRFIGLLMCSALILLVAFVAGFALRSNLPLMESLGIPTGEATASSSVAPGASTSSAYETLTSRVSEVEDILSAYSMDEVPLDAGTSDLIESLMRATGDPYAEYFTEDRYKSYVKDNSSDDVSGIGVLFADYDGRAYAIDVLSDSEAEAEGVMQGDFVVAIDGDSSHSWSASEVISELASSAGDSVVITWMRPVSLDANTGDEFTTTLMCSEFEEPNVGTRLDEEVGYIRLKQFTSNASDLVNNAVDSLVEKGAKALVIDISDNPGGYLTQSLDTASLFVSNGILVSIETNEGISTRNAAGTTITSLPVVVVTNKYTSGTAEVFAAALKGNGRATLVGQTTMGKGSVQVTRELSFGGAVRYTAAYYLTPDGQPINEVGVTPDVDVQATDEEDEEAHAVSVAMEIARSDIGS